VNADVYYIRWNNVQQLLTLQCSYPFSANIGTGESYGPELELSAKLHQYVSFSFSGNYTTARITSVDPAFAGNTIGATEPLAPGIPILNVPRYTFSESIDLTIPVADHLKFIGRLSATTTSSFHDIDYYVQELPGYTIADLRLGLSGDAWS